MVSMESLSQRLQEEFLSCQICMESYVDPKSLPCMHTFCKACLTNLVSRHVQQKMKCPVCRQEIQVPPNGVDGFATNFLLVNLKDTIQESVGLPVPSLSCDPCKFHNVNATATAFCENCNENLCEKCVYAHGRTTVTRAHKLRTMEDGQCGKDASQPVRYCDIHDGQEVTEYCTDCSALCCHMCKGGHIGHCRLGVDAAILQVQKQTALLCAELQSYVEKGETQLKNLNAAKESLNIQHTVIMEFVQNARSKIDETAREHMATLDQKKRSHEDHITKEAHIIEESIITPYNNAMSIATELASGNVNTMANFNKLRTIHSAIKNQCAVVTERDNKSFDLQSVKASFLEAASRYLEREAKVTVSPKRTKVKQMSTEIPFVQVDSVTNFHVPRVSKVTTPVRVNSRGHLCVLDRVSRSLVWLDKDYRQLRYREFHVMTPSDIVIDNRTEAIRLIVLGNDENKKAYIKFMDDSMTGFDVSLQVLDFRRTPGCLAQTSHGYIVMSCPTTHIVLVVKEERGNLDLILELKGDDLPEESRFLNPHQLTCSLLNNDIIVCDGAGECLKVFTIRGRFLFSYGQKGDDVHGFNNLRSVATDEQGHVFALDAGNRRVHMLTSRGQLRGHMDLNSSTVDEQYSTITYLQHNRLLLMTQRGHARVVQYKL